MRHGGTLTIQSPDILQMVKALYWGSIDIDRFSSMLSNSVTYCSIITTKTLLEQHGYSIEEGKIHTDSFIFTLKAKRL